MGRNSNWVRFGWKWSVRMNELDRWNFGSFLTRSMGGAKGLSQSDIVFRMTKVSKTPYHCLIKSPYRKVFQVHHRPIKGLFVVIHFLLIPSDICYIIFSWIPDWLFEFKKCSKLISIEAITPNAPIWRPGFDSRISYFELEIALDVFTNWLPVRAVLIKC